METITDSRGSYFVEGDPPKHNPADSWACSGLRTRLRLEQRLLRPKDGNGLWWSELSSEIIVEVHGLFRWVYILLILDGLWYLGSPLLSLKIWLYKRGLRWPSGINCIYNIVTPLWNELYTVMAVLIIHESLTQQFLMQRDPWLITTLPSSLHSQLGWW
jgi:hypothetical protein